MIRIRVDIVVRVLDGFTGKPPAALRWQLDGFPCRPIAKGEGYYVLTNLPDGPHELIIRGSHYAEEKLSVTTGEENGPQELLVTMKPGAGYPFGGAVTWLTLAVQGKKKAPVPGARVWIAPKTPLAELRVAQDVIQAGETGGRLFFPASAKALALPREFLLLDGEKTEVCRLEEWEEPRFAAPLKADHKRSCCLYPAQVYTAGEDGIIRAVFREPVPLELFAEGAKGPVSLELQAGENESEIKV